MADIQDMMNRIKEQKKGDAKLASYITSQRSNAPAIYTFFNKRKDRVAVVQDFGNSLRILRFDRRGPSGHSNVNSVDSLGYELRMDGFTTDIDPEAGQTLETWTRTPEWERGLLQLEFLAIWNTLSFHGHYNLIREMDNIEDASKAVALGKEFCREFRYKIW